MKKIALTIFGLVSTAVLISTVVELPLVHRLCKPLIMLSLSGYYLASVNPEDRTSAVLVALFFSFLGDTLLMFVDHGDMYFMLGLAAFLIAHVFYIFSYRQLKNPSHPDELQGVQRIRMAFPIVLAGTGLVIILYPSLDSMKVPVLLYALTIVIMVLNALFRYGRTQPNSFWLVFVGAVLFMISDSLIAMNKFLHVIPRSDLWIMSTYIVAQLLIVKGLLHHKFSNT